MKTYILNKYEVILIFFIIFIFANPNINNKPFTSVSDEILLPDIPQDVKDKAITKLRKDIDNLLNDKGLVKTKAAVAVFSVDEDTYYYQKNIDELFTPASTTKVFTSFSALYTLGSDYLIRTSVYTDGKIEDGILKGDLYIYGRGDVLLSTSDLEVLADKIKSNGIQKIEGDIFADASYFDEMTNRKEYSMDLDIVEPLPPVTALSIQKNLATIIITSGNQPGTAVNVSVIPHSESFLIDNNALVKGNKSKTQSIKEINPSSKRTKNNSVSDLKNRAGDSPLIPKRRRNSLSIMNTQSKNGKQKFIVNGYLSPNQVYSYSYFIQNPPLAAAGALKYSLSKLGINVTGKIEERKLSIPKSKAIVLGEFYRSLLDIITITNKESDNFLAENLFKMIGAYAGEHDNNGRRSREIQKMIFYNNGIDFDNCILNDGSGLSRRNLITARSLISIMVKAQYLPFADDFYDALPLAGVDGTLHRRMKNTYAFNNLSAKTGTLRNVSALTGYVSTLDGELLAFAFIFNGPYVYNYKAMEDRLGILLASFCYDNNK